MKNLIVFGPPGAGKGTFSAIIQQILPNIVHISTGDILRKNIKKKTFLGLKAEEYMNRGELVPDQVVIDMIREKLKKPKVQKYGFILDGFPRTLDQAKALSDITKIDLFLLLEVPRDVIKKRILGRFSCSECGWLYNIYTLQPKEKIGKNKWICDNCGAEIEFQQRDDDTEETLEKRLDVYEENSKPIIIYYENKGILKRVYAQNTLDLSEEEIKEIIEVENTTSPSCLS
ncbi:MAG: adenylate kinase [Candidatus Lokiarchaeota archaeon]|nr:adenylate kinase [Candidatus Lokiarchaeota archaeon]MBD3200588.1 adenylate kinase [Candidatus Lokiarchaeota archaeon]